MGSNINEKVFNYIKQNDNLFDNVVLLRLYNDYKNNVLIYENEFLEKDIDVLNIKVSCDKILNQFDKIKVSNDDLMMYKNMLINYVNNFNKKDKQKIHDFVCLITTLESYFKLSISFPEYLLECINIKLDNSINKKVVR